MEQNCHEIKEIVILEQKVTSSNVFIMLYSIDIEDVTNGTIITKKIYGSSFDNKYSVLHFVYVSSQ